MGRGPAGRRVGGGDRWNYAGGTTRVESRWCRWRERGHDTDGVELESCRDTCRADSLLLSLNRAVKPGAENATVLDPLVFKSVDRTPSGLLQRTKIPRQVLPAIRPTRDQYLGLRVPSLRASPQSRRALRSVGMVVVVVVGSIGICACFDREEGQSQLSLDRDGVRQISLEVDPLAGGTYQDLEVSWDAGGGTEGHFVDVAAATRTADGDFAVLDRFNRSVTIVGVDGRLREVFGREGDGPGEFQDPRDIVALGSEVWIWDLPQTTFELLDDSGRFVGELRLPEPGDLSSLTGRIDLELEDLSRRIQAASRDQVVIVQIEDNERALLSPDARGAEDVSRDGYLVAYDSTLTVGDTLVTYRAPTRSVSPSSPSYGPPIFSPQYSWDVGALGIFHGSNESPELELLDLTGQVRARLSWEATRMAISSAHRLAHVRSFYREQAPYLPSNVREQWDGNTALHEQAAEQIVVADSAPVFSRAWLAGRCAAVSPFDPSDSGDGTAQRLVFVGLDDGSIVGRFGFGRSGSDRALWLNPTGVLTKHTDELGVQSVRYFMLPRNVQVLCEI